MSGYDKSPDYGGPPATWRSYVLAGAVLAIGAAPFVVLLLRWLDP